MVAALFDSNILVDHMRGFPQAKAEVDRYEDRAISIVTWIEIMVGVPDHLTMPAREFLGEFSVVGLDRGVAERAVTIRKSHRLKLPDAVIWAAAQTTGRLLVTRNTKDFPVDDPGVRSPYVL
ncbi:type II toxin-antitoxin system VapC family toxin [Brevundimonas sp. PAMC22021]|uniref:type II toxin-antitoxin system VapC family toxin n=1 Tax=Brevundimonas sp. PAMC22021 TaxID=2861285 RepID=UPI001C627B1F|nr:type II toxin-antitoxin system VapC family toxin [Brevundimonas sp. PAMC22021]QYF86806.1 type II toxin-antitoxin system VapC family toxin [Brevundimonas sp. PAMC22021]